MKFSSLQAMQQENLSRGSLQITVNTLFQDRPIPNASISISYTGEPDSVIEELTTDSSGQSPIIQLPTPPLEYSLSPSENQPYSEYNIQIRAEGFEPVSISGTELLPDVTAIQPVKMATQETGPFDRVVIPDHTLFGEYPPKIPEAEVKPMEETGEIVLSRVVVPEYVVVHDGVPEDSTANNYYVRYRDYIKNVACSEIYATWPTESIRANVLAIMSFTLNRVYTEWYRNKGYDFTITSSTAYDQKWMPGRNIFTDVASIVDEVFANYLSRPDVRQPILTQYCDGQRVQCPNAMSQWGSKYLGDQGYSTIDILRYYYGDDMYINTAEEISGIPASWPGYNLTIGSSGSKVLQLQEQLNAVGEAYPLIPSVIADGIYGENTQNAVRVFQQVFGLPQTGIVDYPTWYKVQEIYVAVTRIAELN
ncbi:MAG: peptidoglycan-binding protein [Ruminococcus sp.]|jgi:hypothetical protein